MTDLILSTHSAGTEPTRPRISLRAIAGVARLMALKPARGAPGRARSRGSPPGSNHLRADIGLASGEDEWWRSLDRW